MTLADIVLLNLRRRKARAAFVLAGLAIGVAAVVALVSLFRSMSQGIQYGMEKYGANIMVVPRTDTLPLTYAGMDLGGVSFRVEEIRQEDIDRIRTIPSAKDLAAVGPMLLGSVDAGGTPAVLAGFDLTTAEVLKPWWRVGGRLPGPAEVMLGAVAARLLKAAPGDRLRIGDSSYPVTGILAETGSQEDDNLVISSLETTRAILGRPGAVSMVEVAAHCAACPIEAIMAEIERVLPTARVTAIKQVVASRMAAMEQFEGFLLEIADEKACCTMVLKVPLTTEQQTRHKSEYLYAGTLPEKGTPLEILGTLRQAGAGYSFTVTRVSSGGRVLIKRL